MERVVRWLSNRVMRIAGGGLSTLRHGGFRTMSKTRSGPWRFLARRWVPAKFLLPSIAFPLHDGRPRGTAVRLLVTDPLGPQPES